MSELNVFMKTKIPSELVGSPSSVPSRLCRKKPNWLAPLVVRASVRWVMTPRTSYSVLLPASGEPSVRGFSVSSVEPWTSPMLSTGAMTWTVNEQLAVPPCASVEVIVTPYDPAGVSAATEISAVAVPPSAVAGVKAVLVMVGTGADTARSTIVSSGSVPVTVRVAAVPRGVDSVPPQASTAGWSIGPPVECVPRPSSVSTGKPVHSAAGSNGSAGLVSPAVTAGMRRSVLSAVLVRSEPHSLPGSKPTCPMTSRTGPVAPPLRSTIASSPLKKLAALVWSAWARTGAVEQLQRLVVRRAFDVLRKEQLGGGGGSGAGPEAKHRAAGDRDGGSGEEATGTHGATLRRRTNLGPSLDGRCGEQRVSQGLSDRAQGGPTEKPLTRRNRREPDGASSTGTSSINHGRVCRSRRPTASSTAQITSNTATAHAGATSPLAAYQTTAARWATNPTHHAICPPRVRSIGSSCRFRPAPR